MANHIIHRINMEIEAPDKQSARLFHDRASLILKNDILPALENYLDSLGWKEEILRMNVLNIDIEGLPEEQIDPGLKNRFMIQIRELLDKKAQVDDDKDENSPFQLSREEKIFETFLYFLLTGRLPWWNTKADAVKLTEVLPTLMAVRKEDWHRRLKELLQTDPRAVHRLMLQFPEKTVLATILYILPAKHQSRPAIKNEIRQALRQYNKHGSLSLPGISIAPLQKTNTQTTDVEEKKHETLSPALKEEEGLFTGHAGLIILHPFLESFLGEYGCLKDSKFISYEAQINAVHLLSYLVTGEENPMEHELILEKYLCGIDFGESLPAQFPVDEIMKQECEKLLGAVIGHWKVLKSTSPSGLRETFLKREGKLLLNDSHHRLVVEGKSTDILLSRLPWSYQVVKLPWMAFPLLTDWTH